MTYQEYNFAGQLADGIKKIDDEGKPLYIPNDPENKDWQEYQAWLALGNEPEPAE